MKYTMRIKLKMKVKIMKKKILSKNEYTELCY